jgi:hypothetical protein
LNLFDPTTGEITGSDEEGCPRCDAHARRAEGIEADLQNAEKELRRLRKALRAAETELRKQREESPEGRTAKVIFRYWITRCEKDPKRTKLGEKRERCVIARLHNGYDATYICRAIDGLAFGAYRNPDTGQRYDDLELVCRDEPHLERFHDLAERTAVKTLIGPAWERLFERELESPGPGDKTVPF